MGVHSGSSSGRRYTSSVRTKYDKSTYRPTRASEVTDIVRVISPGSGPSGAWALYGQQGKCDRGRSL